MPNFEHLEIVKKGMATLNRWRRANRDVGVRPGARFEARERDSQFFEEVIEFHVVSADFIDQPAQSL